MVVMVKPAPPPLRLNNRGRSQKVAEIVAQSIAEYILKEDLKPGDALPNEKIMTESLAVGRATLREGLRLLETQGVLVIRPGPGGGPVLRETLPDDLASSMTLMLQSMRVSFLQVVEARTAIEPEIARAAALNRSDDQLEPLREACDVLVASPNQPGEFRAAYNIFHELLGEMTGNVVLQVLASTLRKVSEPLHEQVAWGPRSERAAVQTHLRLVTAIEKRDADAARHEVADHMHWYHSYFERRYPHLLSQIVRWTA
ncbi:MAG: FCD domain-containing protein [Actinobacteria bacterium]|nr:FCD domain-containing protein [Actinomycetota bacterium]